MRHSRNAILGAILRVFLARIHAKMAQEAFWGVSRVRWKARNASQPCSAREIEGNLRERVSFCRPRPAPARESGGQRGCLQAMREPDHGSVAVEESRSEALGERSRPGAHQWGSRADSKAADDNCGFTHCMHPFVFNLVFIFLAQLITARASMFSTEFSTSAVQNVFSDIAGSDSLSSPILIA